MAYGNDMSETELLKNDIQYIKEAVNENKRNTKESFDKIMCKLEELPNIYVTKEQFQNEIKPLKVVVYGTISAICTAFLTALIALIIRNQ